MDPSASWAEHIHWELMPYTVPIGLLTEGACVHACIRYRCGLWNGTAAVRIPKTTNEQTNARPLSPTPPNAGILHANNARDIEMDAKTGTLTLARTSFICLSLSPGLPSLPHATAHTPTQPLTHSNPGLLGFWASRQLFLLLLAGAYASSGYLALTAHLGNALVLLTLPLAVSTASKFQHKVRAGLLVFVMKTAWLRPFVIAFRFDSIQT